MTQSGQFAPFQATQSGWYDCVAWTQGGAHAAARFHHAHRKCGGVATRGRRAANDARHWISKKHAGCAAHLVDAFRRGLGEIGYVEGKNVAIEERWANNQSGQLPALAADLVAHGAVVIVGNGPAVDAVRKIALALPFVFVVGGDPVALGLVASLNRPGGNLTGVTFFSNNLGSKRLGILRELVPAASVIAVLFDPSFPEAVDELRAVEDAGRNVGQKTISVKAAPMNKNLRPPSKAWFRLALVHLRSLEAHSSPAKPNRWSRYRRIMPFRRSMTFANMSQTAA